MIDLDEPFLESLDPVVLKQAIDRVRGDDRLFAVSRDLEPTYYDLLAFESDDMSFRSLESDLQQRTGPTALLLPALPGSSSIPSRSG